MRLERQWTSWGRGWAANRRLAAAAWAALAMAVASGLCVGDTGDANAAPAVTGALQAFVLTGAPDSFADLQRHVESIDAIYPTYYECAVPSGALMGTSNPELDAYAGAHHLAELPRYTCQTGATVHRILTEPALRERTLAGLAALARAPAYAGLNLDLENDGPGDRDALSSFVQALARRLHAERRELAVDVVGATSEPISRPAAGLYDYRAISAAADTVFVMAWGTHWEHSGPGPIAPLAYVRGVAKFVASLPYARRFVLGTPMYGLDWPVPNGNGHSASAHAHASAPARALQYAEALALARSVGAAPVRDPSSGELTFAYTRAGVAHRVWYMDAQSIADCLQVAREYGLSGGVWRLGSEDQTLWSSPFVAGNSGV
jgi:spore germination protein YaaH